MSKKKRTGSFSPAGNNNKRRQGIVLSPAEGAEPMVRTPRIGPRKTNLAAQLIRGGNSASVREYKKAGYDIFGTTRDGVVIVKPSGAPDSFDLNQLDMAFSRANSKNWR
jgi:hypothetical protein